MIGDAAPDRVELDPAANAVSIGGHFRLLEGQHLRLQELKLQIELDEGWTADIYAKVLAVQDRQADEGHGAWQARVFVTALGQADREALQACMSKG